MVKTDRITINTIKKQIMEKRINSIKNIKSIKINKTK